MATRIQLRRDTAANWTAANPVLAQGEPAIETDTGLLKIGDGSTAWNSLPYASSSNVTPVAVKTSGYTAAYGDFVPVDPTSGNVVITLPAAVAGHRPIAVKQIVLSSHTVTVAAAGADVFNKAGGSVSLTLVLLNQGVTLVPGNGVWYVQSDDLPLSQLDTRFASIVDPLAVAAGFRNWNAHPASFNANTALTSKAIYTQAVYLPAGPVTGLVLHIITAGVGTAPTGFFVGLHNQTNMLAQSVNLAGSPALTTIGFAQFPLSAVYNLPTAGYYYVCVLENGAFTGTTVKFLSSNAVYGGLAGAPPLGGTIGTNQIALPANGAAVAFDAGSSNGGKFVGAY